MNTITIKFSVVVDRFEVGVQFSRNAVVFFAHLEGLEDTGFWKSFVLIF